MSNLRFSQTYSYNSQNSDNEQILTLPLETVLQSSLFLDQKEVYDHYSFLKKYHLTKPIIARLINLLALFVMCMLLFVGIIMVSIFTTLGIYYSYSAITIYSKNTSDSEFGAMILFGIICFCMCIMIGIVTGGMIYYWRMNFKIRLLYICHAKRLLHFAPGYRDYHESITLI